MTAIAIHTVRAANWARLNETNKHGIFLLAEELRGLFTLTKRKFDKYATKFPQGDDLLKEFKIGKANRQHLEYMLCVLGNTETLGQKERIRIRLVIDGVVSVAPAKIAGLQWNKAVMTDAHDKRGGSSRKTTANYKKK